MEIYAIIITVIAVVLAIGLIKWKIATKALVLFCKEQLREPTDKEIADCTKRAIGRKAKENL